MEIIKKFEIKSSEARYLMNKKMKGGSIYIVAALIQLSRLYHLAGKEYLYPYIALIKICGEMSKARSTMEKLIHDFNKVLKKYQKEGDQLINRVRAAYELRIDNPIAGELVNLIELFDELSCLLWTTNNLNLFQEGRYRYFKAVDQNSKRILGILRLIFALGKDTGKTTTILEYLDNDAAYQEARKSLGIVKPALLFSALHIEALPRFTAKRRNIILKKLKKM